jgi:hypothetical protein
VGFVLLIKYVCLHLAVYYLKGTARATVVLLLRCCYLVAVLDQLQEAPRILVERYCLVM